jgi:hypothetical protein
MYGNGGVNICPPKWSALGMASSDLSLGRSDTTTSKTRFDIWQSQRLES